MIARHSVNLWLEYERCQDCVVQGVSKLASAPLYPCIVLEEDGVIIERTSERRGFTQTGRPVFLLTNKAWGQGT